jgi:hypothetical protein
MKFFNRPSHAGAPDRVPGAGSSVQVPAHVSAANLRTGAARLDSVAAAVMKKGDDFAIGDGMRAFDLFARQDASCCA